MVSIPKSEIVSITVCYGQSVEKPILQMIAGVLTSLLGFFMGVWPLVGYIYDPGTLKGGSKLLPYGLALPLILIGIYLIAPVFRKCYYLIIATPSGKRKIPSKDCGPAEVADAGRSLDYLITEDESIGALLAGSRKRRNG